MATFERETEQTTVVTEVRITLSRAEAVELRRAVDSFQTRGDDGQRLVDQLDAALTA